MIRLFGVFFLFLGIVNVVDAGEITIKIYPEEGKGGLTSDGRTFEDRYKTWSQTVNSVSSRIASSNDNHKQDISNSYGNGFGPNYYTLNRLHFSFLTTIIPENATIKSSSFNFYGASGDSSAGSEKRIYLVKSNPANPGALVVGDYSRVGNESYGATDNVWNINDWNTINLNDLGIESINRSGVSSFALRGWYDFYGVAPTNENKIYVHTYLSETPGTDKDPYLEITYIVPDANTAPVFDTVSSIDVNEGDSVVFNVLALDAEGDEIVYSAENIPLGATFNEYTREFTWTPSYTQAGVYTVTFSATDNGTPSQSSQMDVVITVKNVATLEELLHMLKTRVYIHTLSNFVEKSYLAHINMLAQMFEANRTAFIQQLEILEQKLASDYAKSIISPIVYYDIIGLVKEIRASVDVQYVETKKVPLITQTISPYPSLAETTSWAEDVYAGGRANGQGDCGLTIRQCGCAITSLVMLGKYRGVDFGIDSRALNPKNINNWLLGNNGYTAGGSILWTYGFAYLGEVKNGKVMSNFAFAKNGLNVTSRDIISSFIKAENPVLGFNAPRGHWMVLTGLTDTGYVVNDPAWYNTKTTNDVRDIGGQVQSYSDVITRAHLIEYTKASQPLQGIIELVLESPAELLITDSRGRKYGHDAETGSIVKEIPFGMYEQDDFILDPSNPSQNPHKAKRLILLEPEGDVFTIEVVGTGVGTFSLSSAVSDGKGSLHGAVREDETTEGAIHQYIIITTSEYNTLPKYLQDILESIPEIHQKKFMRAFAVVFSQTQKGNIVATTHLIENLIRFIEKQYGNESWSVGVIEALREML